MIEPWPDLFFHWRRKELESFEQGMGWRCILQTSFQPQFSYVALDDSLNLQLQKPRKELDWMDFKVGWEMKKESGW